MSVGVLGATPVDAQRGVACLAQLGLEDTRPLWISSNPKEQSDLHSSGSKDLEERVTSAILDHGAHRFLVYCNSLSFALSWEAISLETGTEIMTLRSVYSEVAARSAVVGCVAADAITLARIDSYMRVVRDDFRMVGFSALTLVEKEEARQPGVRQILRSFVCSAQGLGAEIFIMGCTHFDVYSSNTGAGISIINPGLEAARRFAARAQQSRGTR